MKQRRGLGGGGGGGEVKRGSTPSHFHGGYRSDSSGILVAQCEGTTGMKRNCSYFCTFICSRKAVHTVGLTVLHRLGTETLVPLISEHTQQHEPHGPKSILNAGSKVIKKKKKNAKESQNRWPFQPSQSRTIAKKVCRYSEKRL